MAGIDFDSTFFPLVRITNHEGTTDADYATMFARFEELLAKGERFVALVGGTGMAMPTASQRKMVGEWMPRVKGRMQTQSLGCALVVKSAVQRGAITALNWIVRPYVPMAAFESEAEAVAWCEARLVDANVAIPPRLRSHLLGAKKTA